MSVKLKPGWLKRQFDNVDREVAEWPDSMKRTAGFEETFAWPYPCTVLHDPHCADGHRWLAFKCSPHNMNYSGERGLGTTPTAAVQDLAHKLAKAKQP